MSLKSWGLELWDQIDKIFLYSNQGLEQVELFYRTVADIHKIHQSLTRKYKALAVHPSNKTKPVLDNSTYNTGFTKFLTCMNEQAGIYETQAEEIREQVLNPLKTFIDALKTTISTQNNEHTKLKNNLENHKRTLDRTWTKYYQAFVTKKRAEANYNKIKDDKTVPRVDIERVQMTAHSKLQEFEKMRGEYASHLQSFNGARSSLFLTELPKLVSELELFDRRRAELSIEAGLALVEIQNRHLARSGTLNAAVGDAIRLVDFRADSASLLAQYRSSLAYPADIVFVDLDRVRGDSFSPADFPGVLQQGGKVEKNDSAKSLFGGPGLRGIDTRDMLHEQVKLRLDELSQATKQVEKVLSGLQTLGSTYQQNPSMGDIVALQPQIDVSERQLASLQDMADAVGKHYRTIGGGGSGSSQAMTTAAAAGGAGSTAAAAGRKSGAPPAAAAAVDSDGDSFSEDEPEEGDSASLHQQQHQQPHGDNDAAANIAVVLYDFEASDSQQLAVVCDMRVRVITYDDSGSGWTLVESALDSAKKGYVPTNYIRMANHSTV